MKKTHRLTAPVKGGDLKPLKAGDSVLLSGTIYTARDMAHKRLISDIKAKRALPFDLAGGIIYYCGPTPPMPGKVIGSAGPTTSSRMDPLTEPLLAGGVKVTVGKGKRGPDVKKALRKHGAVYLAAVGGAGALLSRSIKKSRVIAYPDLGPEAIFELTVKDLPAVVAIDLKGRDVFEEGVRKYRKK